MARSASAVRLLLALSGALAAVLLSGCATTGAVPPAGAAKPGTPGVAAKLPDEFPVTLNLNEGDSWKSRFVSTGELKRTLKDPGGKETVKARTLGLSISAAQKVASVSGGAARIEVTESAVSILQEGKFIEAPFRRLNPPNPVHFSIDLATGKADFSDMEAAYRKWMASVKEGPAGDIFGKSFRVESYVAQLKELYAKPFNRSSGKKLAKIPKVVGTKDLSLPFLGPGVVLGPIPVETTAWYEGFDVGGGAHRLKVAGTYGGKVELAPEEIRERFEDMAAPVPGSWKSSGEVRGQYSSTVDVMSGRELRSESQLRYSATASSEGGTFSEEIAAKSSLEPAD